MKIVNTKITQEKWVTNEQNKDEVYKVKLRRFPMSLSIFAPNDSDGIVKAAWQRFDYCITDWEGLVDEDEQPLEYNEKNKRLVFDFSEDIMIWVALEINKLDAPLKKK